MITLDPDETGREVKGSHLETERTDLYPSPKRGADDILSKVPSVSSEDEKTIGILVPPFGYFAKKF